MRLKNKKNLLVLTSCLMLSLFVGTSVSNNTNAAKAVTEKTDVLTSTKFGVSGTSYTSKTYTSEDTGIVYSANLAGSYSSIQLRSTNNNSGIVVTKNENAYQVKKIKVTYNSNTAAARVLNIYGSSSAYTSAADLYNTSKRGDSLGTVAYSATAVEFSVTGNYNYFGVRSNSGAMYISEIAITWELQDLNKYKVSFNANGGTFADESKWEEKEFDKDQTSAIILPKEEDLETTLYKYSVLTGWSDGTTIYEPGESVVVSDVTTFAAVYEGTQVTIAQALEIGNSLNNKEETTLDFTIEGFVEAPYQSYDNSWEIVDDNANKIVAYNGSYAETIAVGDKVKVIGKIYNFNNTIEFSSGCSIEKIVSPYVTISIDEGYTTEVYTYDDETEAITTSLTAVVGNTDDYTIEWFTDNENVVSIFDVEEMAEVSAVSTGEANVYAKITVDGKTYESNKVFINSYSVTTLAAPTNFSFNKEELTLSWDNVINADYYLVEYMNNSTGFISDEISVDTNSIKLTDLEQGDYEFVVKACSNNTKLYKESEEGLFETTIALSSKQVIENTSTSGLLGFKFTQKESSVTKTAQSVSQLSTEPHDNFASQLGLDENLFSVTKDDHSAATKTIFNNGSKETRLYSSSSNGTEIIFKTLDGSIIDSVVIHFGGTVTNYKFNSNSMSAVKNGSSDVLVVNQDGFTIQNVGNSRLDIKSIDINVQEKANTFENIRMRFVANIDKEAVDSLGTITKAGVKVAAEGKAEVMDIEVDPSIIATHEENGKEYYTFIGTVTNIPVSAKDLNLTAQAYIVIGEQTYNLQSVTYSLNSMVDKYLETEGLLNAEELELMNKFKNYLANN